MKKLFSLFLILAFVLTISATALAASTGSFSDVPAKHWAYDAVAKLAKDGLISGYSDGSFQGDKPISRYEFAFLTAKALDRYDQADVADQQRIDKLSAEFATELNRLGARLAKVEAKQKVWFGGETRMRWNSDNPSPAGSRKLSGADRFDFRQRVKFWANISDNTLLTGRLSTDASSKFGGYESTATGSNIGLDILNVSMGKVFGLDNVRIGRSSLDFFSNGTFSKAWGLDGILLQKQIGTTEFKGWTGNIKPDPTISSDANQFTSAQLSFKAAPGLDLAVGHYWSDVQGTSHSAPWNTYGSATNTLNTTVGSFSQSRGWDIGATYKFGAFTLLADYVTSHLDRATGIPANPKGYWLELSTRKVNRQYYPAVVAVDPNKTGTDAWIFSYRSMDPGTIPGGISGGSTSAVEYTNNPYSVYNRPSDNTKVFLVAYERVLAKGTVLSLEYQDFKIKNRALTDLTADQLDKCYTVKMEWFY